MQTYLLKPDCSTTNSGAEPLQKLLQNRAESCNNQIHHLVELHEICVGTQNNFENVVRAHKAKLTKSDASDAQKALVKQVESHFSQVVWDLGLSGTAQSASFPSMLPSFLLLSSCMVQQMRLALRSPKHYFASKKTVSIFVQRFCKFC